MKHLIEYIKECLDVENFAYKFDVWFKKDKEHYQPMLDLLTDLRGRKIVTRDDIDNFLEKHSNFKIKNFVDFFDEEVVRDEAINVDYIYLFTKILEQFINNFDLQNKIDYSKQALNNGNPNTKVDTPPMGNENGED